MSNSYDPMHCTPPGSSVHGISQARILELVAIFLLQGIFPTQGSNPCLWYWQTDSVNFPYKCSFPGGSAGKESTCNVGDLGLILRLGRSPGEGNSYPLEYPGRKNSDRGAWWATQSMGRKVSDATGQDTTE